MADNASLCTDPLHLLCPGTFMDFSQALYANSGLWKNSSSAIKAFRRLLDFKAPMPIPCTIRWLRRRWRMQRFYGWTLWRFRYRLRWRLWYSIFIFSLFLFSLVTLYFFNQSAFLVFYITFMVRHWTFLQRLSLFLTSFLFFSW